MKRLILALMALFMVACGGSDLAPAPTPTVPSVEKPLGFCQCDISWANGRKLEGGVIFGDNSIENGRQITIGVELQGDAPKEADVLIRAWGFAERATKSVSNIYWAKFTLPSHHTSVLIEAYTINSHCVGTHFIYGLR